MTDYTKLVEALRCRSTRDWTNCGNCKYADEDDDPRGCWGTKICADAAAAIEALQAENADIREELFISQRKYDEFTTIASMQNAMLAKQLPKRGEWIVREVDSPGEMHTVAFRCMCSMCRNEYVFPRIPQYCPDCGSMNTAKMEAQE